MVEETPSPLMGEGWGGGEKPQLIELLPLNDKKETALAVLMENN